MLVECLPARLTGKHYVSIAPDDNLAEAEQKLNDWKTVSDVDNIELNKITEKEGCSILSNEDLTKSWSECLQVVGLQQLSEIIKALDIVNKTFEIKDENTNVDVKDFVILANKIKYGEQECKIENFNKVTINAMKFELNIKNPVSLSCDEGHRVVEEDLYKCRMALLSTLCPLLFLNATPSAAETC